MSGSPELHRRSAHSCGGDGYLLYSIGWNQKDDGGVISTDDREGDWVWPSP